MDIGLQRFLVVIYEMPASKNKEQCCEILKSAPTETLPCNSASGSNWIIDPPRFNRKYGEIVLLSIKLGIKINHMYEI